MPLISSALDRLERLNLPIPRSLVLFVAVGLAGLGVHTAVFSLCFHAGWLDKSESWLAALTIATVVTWSLNRAFTFAPTGRRSGVEILRYTLVTLVSQGVSYGVFMGASGLLPQFPPQVALLIGAAVATAFSYSGQRFFTFAPYQQRTPIAVGDTPVLVAVAPDAPR